MRWSNILDRVAAFRAAVFERKRSEPFYRGQVNQTWKLHPSLFRSSWTQENSRQVVIDEQRLYWRFMRLGAHLLPASQRPWETLFVMQQHGVPTRLLDWTESFAIALWFALNKMSEEDPCVWMLDPYGLNNKVTGNDAVLLPDYDFIGTQGYEDGYEPYVVNIDKKSFIDFPHSVTAIGGVSSLSRLQSQRGVFTLHRDPELIAEQNNELGECFKKIRIPRALTSEAREFLTIANINEFTVFPDLDGLSRHLRQVVLAERSDKL